MLHKPIQTVWESKRGVSTVIAVVLMVAVTVVMAGGIGVYLFGFEVSAGPAPATEFAFDDSGSEVIVTVEGGQTIDAQNTEKIGADVSDSNIDYSNAANVDSDGEVTGEIATGDEIMRVDTDEAFQIVWQAPDNTNSEFIAEYTP